MVTIEDVYERMGFEELDTFITKKHAANVRSYASFGELDMMDENGAYCGIGASTWMCAHATASLINGSDALLIGKTMSDANRLAVMVISFIDRIRPFGIQEKEGFATTAWGKTLRWSNEQGFKSFTGSGLMVGTIFNDPQWKQRTIRRAQGPWAMIREIRYEGGYFAYAEDNEFLMELAMEGVVKILNERKEVAAVGFLRDDINRVVDPPMKGALGFNPSVHRTMLYRNRR